MNKCEIEDLKNNYNVETMAKIIIRIFLLIVITFESMYNFCTVYLRLDFCNINDL